LNILILDASTNLEFISLSANMPIDNKCCEIGQAPKLSATQLSHNKNFTIAKEMKVSHSRSLLINLNSLLKKGKIKIDDLDLIGVGVGPGSFTGLRIAVATSRMLAQTLKIPLVDIASPFLFANSVKLDLEENILVAFDAKKGRVFGALYKKKEGRLKEIIPPGDYQIDFLLQKIDQQKIFLIGDGISRYEERINFKEKKFHHLKNFQPEGEVNCNFILNKYLKNPDKYKNFYQIKPFYARLSEAEINKK